MNKKYSAIVYIADKNDSGLEMVSNLAFYNDDAVPSQKLKCSFFSNLGQIYNKSKQDNPIPSPDYTNGVFTQGDKYSNYGASR